MNSPDSDAAKKLSQLTSEQLGDLSKVMLQKQPCGICKQTGNAGIVWHSLTSLFAHTKCFERIKDIEQNLLAAIHEIFADEILHGHSNLAHAAAIAAIEERLQGMTLLQHLEAYGEDSLKQLFDTIGMEAVNAYADYVKQEEPSLVH